MTANVIGPPVRGENFFNRSTEIVELWQRLETAHILLLAPRRVGKTSLMYRLLDGAKERRWLGTYISVGEAESELQFTQKLYKGIQEHDLGLRIVEKLSKNTLGRCFKRLKKADGLGFSIELADADQNLWSELSEALLMALAAKREERWLLLVDELPIFVLTLLRQDPSGGRARHFLNWFRALRQSEKSKEQVRWLLAGSIGLDNVARRRNLGDTINDLFPYTDLGAFSEGTADTFLEELAQTHKIPLSPEIRKYMRERVGWLIPFHLQILFSEVLKVYERKLQIPGVEQVDAAYETLLNPAHRVYFDYWKQRLHEELGAPEDEQAIALLNAIAKDPRGATRNTLRSVLMKQRPSADEIERRLHEILDVLQSDGYVVESSKRFIFRSSMLGAFWKGRISS